MKIHNFIESAQPTEYHRVIFCTRCGQISWNFNWNKDLNEGLQKAIKPCVEGEELHTKSTQ